MLPNVLPHTELTTSPSSPTACASCSPCARARPSSTRRSARAGTRACSPRSRGPGKLVAIDRDPSPKSFFDRFRRAQAWTSGSFAATSRSCSASSRRTTSRPTRSCSTSASRRCRSTAPSAASPTRPTRRSTCGWIRPPSRRAAAIVNTWDERELVDDLPPLRGGALRRPDRAGDRAPARGDAVHAHGRPRGRDQARDPDARALRRGPSRRSGCSRRCGSR